MANIVLLFHDGQLFLTGTSIQQASLAAGNIGGPGWVIEARAGFYNEHVILTRTFPTFLCKPLMGLAFCCGY
jgi:hypothetical protein